MISLEGILTAVDYDTDGRLVGIEILGLNGKLMSLRGVGGAPLDELRAEPTLVEVQALW